MSKLLLEYIEQAELDLSSDNIEAGDDFVLELAEDTALETYVIESWDDCIILAADSIALDLLESFDCKFGIEEAKYQGCNVPLGKRMAGDVKKSKVYVRKPNGNVVKVNFGDKKLSIKKGTTTLQITPENFDDYFVKKKGIIGLKIKETQ